jgi:hypothetical protein
MLTDDGPRKVGDFATLIQIDKQQALMYRLLRGSGASWWVRAKHDLVRFVYAGQADTAADLDAALFGSSSSSSSSSSGEATAGSAGDGAVAVGLANLEGVLGLEFHVEYVRLLSIVAAAPRGGVKG